MVTGIMCRYSHNSACTVGNKYIVGYEYRYLSAVYGIDSVNAVNSDACLILSDLCTLKV